MKRLPPLSAIEAFVRTARLGSLKAAAQSLALSAPALSRRIQTLERHVGHPLFERRHQGVLLNPDGERLLANVAPAVDALEAAIDGARKEARPRLRLASLPLFASSQLIPRLPALRARHPELHIGLDTRPDPLARLDEEVDAAITLAAAIRPSLYALPLGSSRVIAIGARTLAIGPGALVRPEELATMTVLLHRDLPDAFDQWREAAALPDLTPESVDHFDSGQLMLDAAAQGLGVAFLFETHLAGSTDGRLARLFDIAASSPHSYWFVCRRRALDRRPVRLFHDWLVEEFAS